MTYFLQCYTYIIVYYLIKQFKSLKIHKKTTHCTYIPKKDTKKTTKDNKHTKKHIFLSYNDCYFHLVIYLPKNKLTYVKYELKSLHLFSNIWSLSFIREISFSICIRFEIYVLYRLHLGIVFLHLFKIMKYFA